MTFLHESSQNPPELTTYISNELSNAPRTEGICMAGNLDKSDKFLTSDLLCLVSDSILVTDSVLGKLTRGPLNLIDGTLLEKLMKILVNSKDDMFIILDYLK